MVDALRKTHIDKTGYFQQDPRELLKRCGPPKKRLIIPAFLIYGVQRLHEYNGSSLSKIAQSYRDFGAGFLDKYPLACCALPVQEQFVCDDDICQDRPYVLAIMDGHHRKRAGLEQGIVEYPIELYSVVQASRFFQHKQGAGHTYATLTDWLSEAEYKKSLADCHQVVFKGSGNELQLEIL